MNTLIVPTRFAGIKDLGIHIKEADLVTTPADEVYRFMAFTTTQNLSLNEFSFIQRTDSLFLNLACLGKDRNEE